MGHQPSLEHAIDRPAALYLEPTTYRVMGAHARASKRFLGEHVMNSGTGSLRFVCLAASRGVKRPNPLISTSSHRPDVSDNQRLHDIAFEDEIEYGLLISLIIPSPDEYQPMAGKRLDQGIAEGHRVV